jgi:hypothetical protein
VVGDGAGFLILAFVALDRYLIRPCNRLVTVASYQMGWQIEDRQPSPRLSGRAVFGALFWRTLRSSCRAIVLGPSHATIRRQVRRALSGDIDTKE